MGQREDLCCGCSVAQSHPTLRPHELQHARFPWPSLSTRVCSNSCLLSQWCHPTISSSVSPFSSCPQHFSVQYRELSSRQSCPQMPASFRVFWSLVCKQKLADNLIRSFYKDFTLWKRSRLDNICESESRSVVSNSLRPHGPYSPWNSPGQNTGVGSLSLLQGIFPTQGCNLVLLHCWQILYQLSHKGRPFMLLQLWGSMDLLLYKVR